MIVLRLLAALSLLPFTAHLLQAQEPRVSLRSQLVFPRSSLLLQDTLSASTAERNWRSPAVATLLSAALPGAGQIYAERYWTIPLVWGFGYWFVRNYIQLDRKYDEWADAYSRSLIQPGNISLSDVKRVRDFYHDERDRFAFYIALTYVLNIVDAYVGASLYNFDVSEDLAGSELIRAKVRIPIQ
ncbi:MAG TPA: DUF5683 domain-containing protein [Bacteroidota bacterium]